MSKEYKENPHKCLQALHMHGLELEPTAPGRPHNAYIFTHIPIYGL